MMAAPLTSLLLCVLLAGALAQSPAPAPSQSGKPSTDGVFILTGASVSFINETTLAIAGVPTNTEWVRFPPHSAAGALPQMRLTSRYLSGRDGRWAGAPQAALSGLYNGQHANILLQLDRPSYSAGSRLMTFQYAVLAANNIELPAVGGTVNDYAMRALDANDGMHNSTLSAVTPASTTFYDASLVVDVVGIEQYTTDVRARTEDGLIHVDLGEQNAYFYG